MDARSEVTRGSVGQGVNRILANAGVRVFGELENSFPDVSALSSHMTRAQVLECQSAHEWILIERESEQPIELIVGRASTGLRKLDTDARADLRVLAHRRRG